MVETGQKREKSRKNAAAKICVSAVYHAGIKHAAPPTVLYLALRRLVRRDAPAGASAAVIPELDYPDISAEKDLLAAVSPQRRLREGGDPSQVLFQRQKWIPAFERVKKNRRAGCNPGRSVVPPQAGTHIRACSGVINGFPSSRE